MAEPVAAQAATTPHAVALLAEGAVMRSRDLERRANQLAHQRLERLPLRVRVHDTQTGLKTRRCDGADQVVDAALIKRFAFGLGLVVLASYFDCRRIVESPVTIDYQSESTTNLSAVFAVFWGTALIYYRLRLLRWNDRSELRAWTLLVDDLPTQLSGH